MMLQQRVRTNVQMWMNLRQLRPIDLVATSGLNKAHISMILNGICNPTISTIEKLAKGLNVKRHLLLYED